MKRKVFRSLTRRKNEIGIKECDGFEAVIKERIYNVYRSDYNTVHIIDPATGMSVFNYHTSELLEMDAAKAAVEKFCKTGYSLNRFQEMVKTEEYKTFVDMFDARHVALMWASPDCTSHSRAKGGRPRKQGLRILPWAVYKHAENILPDVIIMENVEEIQLWGPLNSDGHPIPERKGEDYRKFSTVHTHMRKLEDEGVIIRKADYSSQYRLINMGFILKKESEKLNR